MENASNRGGQRFSTANVSPTAPRPHTAERLLSGYKRWVSPLLHGVVHTMTPFAGGCRFQPTCSEYAALAITRHGWLRGGRMALWRLLRCHPFARGGFDPVPEGTPRANNRQNQLR
jgi:putative membrane protein insertion efficiency factor